MLVVVSMLGAAGVSYAAYTNYLSPPLQLFGICNGPGDQLGNVGGVYAGVGGHVGCQKYVQTFKLVNGQNETVGNWVPSGTYEYLNGSATAP